MVVREGPVDEIHIKIITFQIPDALRAGLLHFSVHVVPHFGHDEEFFALYHAFVKRRLEHFPDLVFISIAGRAVKHPVAAAERPCHCI